ncbi:MAG: phosphotransferase family protein, partial [Promethearchaeota archaeon]
MDEDRLRRYLRSSLGQDDINVHNLQYITSGWETEILSFDLEKSTGQVLNLVARIYPGADAVSKAQKESSIMRKIHEIGYPVPRVHIVETESFQLGNPFIIMDRINGNTLDDKLHEDQRRWLRVFFDLFVRLHKLDWRRLTPQDKIPMFEDPYFYIKSTLSEIEIGLKHIGKEEFLPIVDWARDRYTDVPCKTPSIIHGDFHPFNILV